jgi:hypothetical protein
MSAILTIEIINPTIFKFTSASNGLNCLQNLKPQRGMQFTSTKSANSCNEFDEFLELFAF